MGLKPTGALTFLLRFAQRSEFLKSRKKIGRRAREIRIFIKTFRIAFLHPEMLRFVEALKQFNSEDEYHPQN